MSVEEGKVQNVMKWKNKLRTRTSGLFAWVYLVTIRSITDYADTPISPFTGNVYLILLLINYWWRMTGRSFKRNASLNPVSSINSAQICFAASMTVEKVVLQERCVLDYIVSLHCIALYVSLLQGFHRYSTDSSWHVPHFEKMLYDQAQLAVAYITASQVCVAGWLLSLYLWLCVSVLIFASDRTFLRHSGSK